MKYEKIRKKKILKRKRKRLENIDWWIVWSWIYFSPRSSATFGSRFIAKSVLYINDAFKMLHSGLFLGQIFFFKISLVFIWR